MNCHYFLPNLVGPLILKRPIYDTLPISKNTWQLKEDLAFCAAERKEDRYIKGELVAFPGFSCNGGIAHCPAKVKTLNDFRHILTIFRRRRQRHLAGKQLLKNTITVSPWETVMGTEGHSTMMIRTF